MESMRYLPIYIHYRCVPIGRFSLFSMVPLIHHLCRTKRTLLLMKESKVQDVRANEGVWHHFSPIAAARHNAQHGRCAFFDVCLRNHTSQHVGNASHLFNRSGTVSRFLFSCSLRPTT
eukprot:GHVU01205418.1.p1 GENE.GHVU01205418.1~~GHVU01205418.1.p1  ORF type:complete len:118 (+),score=0.89 GHVU01205418.1:309-662(+)